MKIKNLKIAIVIITFMALSSCKSQQNHKTKSTSPKIDNYNKGELLIKVAPFGLNGNEITVGNILKDGSIIFNWPQINTNTINGSEYFMEPIKKAVGMIFCNDKQIIINNEKIKVVNAKNLFLYKNNHQVGSLFPATKKEMADNNGLNRNTTLVLGSQLFWIYSNGDGDFKATCTVNKKYDNSYHFKEVTNYDIQLKKGWNPIQTTLIEKEDWINENDKGSLPKKIAKISITKIPENIHWYLKYWGE